MAGHKPFDNRYENSADLSSKNHGPETPRGTGNQLQDLAGSDSAHPANLYGSLLGLVFLNCAAKNITFDNIVRLNNYDSSP